MQWQNSTSLKELKLCFSKAKTPKELNVFLCFTSSTLDNLKRALGVKSHNEFTSLHLL